MSYDELMGVLDKKINEKEIEDIALGVLMDKMKTNVTVPKSEILRKLKK